MHYFLPSGNHLITYSQLCSGIHIRTVPELCNTKTLVIIMYRRSCP